MSETNGQHRRRLAIVDVAKHAGVSTASASKALRNAYGASESMRERTLTIGVVVSDIERTRLAAPLMTIAELEQIAANIPRRPVSSDELRPRPRP